MEYSSSRPTSSMTGRWSRPWTSEATIPRTKWRGSPTSLRIVAVRRDAVDHQRTAFNLAGRGRRACRGPRTVPPWNPHAGETHRPRRESSQGCSECRPTLSMTAGTASRRTRRGGTPPSTAPPATSGARNSPDGSSDLTRSSSGRLSQRCCPSVSPDWWLRPDGAADKLPSGLSPWLGQAEWMIRP